MNQLAEALLKRYRDAYGVAEGTVKLGTLPKKMTLIALIGGLLLGGIVGSIGSEFFGGMIVFFGLLIAVLAFISGVMIAAQGQIMLAMLDTAVNTSPSADLTEKAAIMGIR